MSIFVARQPIFDRDGRLSGYELLYRRNAERTFADGDDPNTMSARVIANALLGMDLDELTGGARSFINFTREQVLEGTYQVLDPTRVVIELLENITYDTDTLAAVQQMHAAGYTIALDDFEFNDNMMEVLQLTSIVKMNVLGRTNEDLLTDIERLRPFEVMLVAEKVETQQDFVRCKTLGFDFYQGYYYARPETITHADVEASNLSVFRLLNLLSDPASTDHAIEQAFAGDPALAYKLMRIVNAASMGGKGIDSIRHAIRLVGRATLLRWVCVLVTASFADEGGMQKELAMTALVRGRLCELIANRLPSAPPSETLFMTGLLSCMDALMRVPMDKVLVGIKVNPLTQTALLERSGNQAPFLLLTEAYESGSWANVRRIAGEIGIHADVVAGLYTESIAWAQETFTGQAA